MTSPDSSRPTFKVGDTVYVRDVGLNRRGYRIIEAKVASPPIQRSHVKATWIEWFYILTGDGLSCSTYPEARLFDTRDGARRARMTGRLFGNAVTGAAAKSPPPQRKMTAEPAKRPGTRDYLRALLKRTEIA